MEAKERHDVLYKKKMVVVSVISEKGSKNSQKIRYGKLQAVAPATYLLIFFTVRKDKLECAGRLNSIVLIGFFSKFVFVSFQK